MSQANNPQRRKILALAAAFAACAPGLALAADKKRVGMLGIEGGGAFTDWKEVFPREFATHGWVEGRNLELVWYGVAATPNGNNRDLREGSLKRAKEMAAAGLDCLVANGLPHATMLRDATRTVPIVVDVPDPVGFGFAKSLSRPGGNITGLHGGVEQTALKMVELLRELVPSTRCIAWIGPENFRATASHYESAARELGLAFRVIAMKGDAPEDAAQLREAMGTLRRQGCLAAVGLPMDTNTNQAMIAAAYDQRIALAGGAHEGFVFRYTAGRSAEAENPRRIPAIVSRILRGEKPGDIPFEGPDRYELAINLKTAARIGVTVPPNVLTRADRVTR